VRLGTETNGEGIAQPSRSARPLGISRAGVSLLTEGRAENCSTPAVRKKPSVQVLAEMIAAEFEQLNP
jgi:hypothetical protein